jgi:hypothetical protein
MKADQSVDFDAAKLEMNALSEVSFDLSDALAPLRPDKALDRAINVVDGREALSLVVERPLLAIDPLGEVLASLGLRAARCG